MDRLGKRLAREASPSNEDLDLLTGILTAYDDVLAEVEQRCRIVAEQFVLENDLNLSLTTRVKTTSTIREKLQREAGMGLKGMQDLAGLRMTGNLSRRQQDALSDALESEFRGEARRPGRVDRRVTPSHGYRALHLIVYPRSLPVEIQIRTSGQDAWAQLVEKLGDAWGRGIRYGQPPPEPDRVVFGTSTRSQLLSAIVYLSEELDRLEDSEKADETDEIELEALREELGSMSGAGTDDPTVADMIGRVQTLKDEAAERRSARIEQRERLEQFLEGMATAAEDWT